MKINGHIILFMTDPLSAPFVHSLVIGMGPEVGVVRDPRQGTAADPSASRSGALTMRGKGSIWVQTAMSLVPYQSFLCCLAKILASLVPARPG